MNHYEVTVKSITVVYVADAKDEAEAIKYAADIAPGDLYDVKALETDDERERARRHADKVSKP